MTKRCRICTDAVAMDIKGNAHEKADSKAEDAA